VEQRLLKLPRMRNLIAASTLSLNLVCSVATAQVIPLGMGQGGRTGGAASPTAGGGDLPLSFPPERDGLPIPLAFVHGASKVMEAGLGWSIPIWSITASQNASRHRPRYDIDAPNTWGASNIEPRVTLSMGGAPIPLVKVDSSGHFRAVIDHQTWQITEYPASWEALDGEGRRYVFRLQGSSNDGFWVLTQIYGSKRGQARVDVHYRSSLVAIGGFSAPELLLDSIEYNFEKTGACGKHKIQLVYVTPDVGSWKPATYPTVVPPTIPSPAPVLSTSLDGGHFRVRTQVVHSVTLSAQGASCGASQTLRTWDFNYGNDPDTQMPRLDSVDQYGRQGTTEESTVMPVVRYGYGLVLPSGTSLSYGAPSYVTLPAGTTTNSVGRLVNNILTGGDTLTGELFADWNGDGMADFTASSYGSPLAIAVNKGGTSLVSTAVPPVAPPGISRTNTSMTPNDYDYLSVGIERTYTQAIDVNGDGRLDFIDAHDTPHQWVIYLNEPSASDPAVPSWQKISIDVTNLQNDINRPDTLDAKETDYLPLQRSKTGPSFSEQLVYDLNLQAYSWDGNPPNLITQSTFVEWKLVDINGDGYPDFVTDSLKADLQSDPDNCSKPNPCTHYARFGWLGQNYLRAYLNRGGAYLSDLSSGSSTPLAAPIQIFGQTPGGTGAVEQWEQRFNNVPYTFTSGGSKVVLPGVPQDREMVYGFLDINGDGILDRVERSVALLGSGWVDTITQPIPNSTSPPPPAYTFGYYIPVTLPGPALATNSSRVTSCYAGGANNQKLHSQYSVKTVKALIDLTGDGIPDYVDVYGVSQSQGSIRVGTGVGFGPAVPISVQGGAFQISKVEEWCDDSGDSITVLGLFDVNGDGRLDLVQAGNSDFTPSSQLTVWQLDGATGGTGALDRGQIISISNGYGATRTLTWGSAKTDTTTQHQVPFPEIVLQKESTTLTQSLGVAPAPTYQAYGDIRLQFDGVLDHWTTRGYNRTVTLSGVPSGDNGLSGTAVISDQLRPEDLNTEYDREVLAGRAKERTTLSGTFARDPKQLLGVNVANDARFSSQTDTSWSTSSAAIAGALGGVTDCTTFVNPFVDVTTKVSRADAACYTTGIGALRSSYDSTGTAAPPSDQSVQSATLVTDVDSLGRPHLILHRNDVNRLDDDFCEERLYATPTTTWQIQTAPKSVRYFVGTVPSSGAGGIAPPTSIMNCATQVRLLSGARFAYDNLAEGSVGLGRITQLIAERYDVTTGVLLDSFTQSSFSYDPDGVLTARTDEAGSGHTVTTSITADGFGIVPKVITTSGSGVSTTLTTTRNLDDQTLLAKDESDQNGLWHHVQRDGFDRPMVTSITDPTDGGQYLAAAFQYLGETAVQPGPNSQNVDQIDPLGRRTLMRTWRDRVPMSTFSANAAAPGANENWQTRYADELGRERYGITNLGPDRPSLIVGSDTTRDLRGRVEFVADPYVSGAAAPHYGTTYFYRPDNSLRCAVRGRGDQTTVGSSTTSDSTQARYASCNDRVFSAHQARLRAWEPDQNLATGAGAYEERVMTGAGRRIEESRHTATTVLELMQLGYDPLGNNTTITRYSAPATPSGAVTWTTSYDSFGAARTVSEPATALRTFTSDRLGRTLSVSWVDGSTTHIVNTEYDAFGRATRNYEGTASAPANENDFHYDTVAPGGYQLAQPFLIGRLSWAQNSLRTIYFSYDGLGRSAATSELDADGTRVDLGYQSRLDGAPSAISYKVPDDGFAIEQAVYGYDSGGALKTVGWQDGSGSSPLFSAVDIDAFGRPAHVHFGNNTDQLNSYNPNDRRELTAWQLTTASSTLSSSFPSYDGEGRTLQRVDVSPSRNDYSYFTYDAADRLATATIGHTNGAVVNNPVYSYDGLGNITSIYDSAGNQNSTRAFDATDGDRLASITTSTLGFPRIFNTTSFTYDVLGSVKTNAGRTFAYDGRGRTQSIAVGANLAQYAYGPLGGVATLSIVGSGKGDNRIEQRFGLVEATTAGSGARVFERHIPGTGVRRRGSGINAAVDYTIGEAKGTRAVTNKTGAIVQEIDYQPFGLPRFNTATPNQSDYENFQFNGGDYLADFGINQLGARLYDPYAARFLSRDPLRIPRSAGRAHPYGFAWNDPINHGDPSGMDPPCTADACLYGSGSNGDGSDSGWVAGVVGIAGTAYDWASSHHGSGPTGWYGVKPEKNDSYFGPSGWRGVEPESAGFLQALAGQGGVLPYGPMSLGTDSFEEDGPSFTGVAWDVVSTGLSFIPAYRAVGFAMLIAHHGFALGENPALPAAVAAEGVLTTSSVASDEVVSEVVSRGVGGTGGPPALPVDPARVAAQFEKSFGQPPEAIYLVGSHAERVLGNAAIDVSKSDVDLFIQTDLTLSKHSGAGFEFFKVLNPGRVPAGVTGIGVGPGELLIGGEGGILKAGLVDPFFGAVDNLIEGLPVLKIW
jgi:RHS repeat-associated protein